MPELLTKFPYPFGRDYWFMPANFLQTSIPKCPFIGGFAEVVVVKSDILPTLILGIECDGAYKHLRRPQMRSPSASNSRELAFLDRHLSRYETPDSTPLPDSFLSRQSIGTIFSNPRLRITLPLA